MQTSNISLKQRKLTDFWGAEKSHGPNFKDSFKSMTEILKAGDEETKEGSTGSQQPMTYTSTKFIANEYR